jgi:hypothetical protein
VFVGGWFTSIGDEWVTRTGLASFDARTGRVTDWDPRPNGGVRTILIHSGEVFVGGDFSRIGGQLRNSLAALDPKTGEATRWNPNPNENVWTLQPLGDAVLVGGRFSGIAGQAQRGLAAVDASTGALTSWRPVAGGEVYCSAITDSVVYVGGEFIGGVPGASLAGFDLTTAAVTSWNPGTDGVVEAMTVLDSTIYAGGNFHTAGGRPRDHLAAFNREGAVVDWAPAVYGPQGTEVHALAARDSTIFVGGYLSGFSGEPRDYFGALDAVSGRIRTEYPTIDGPVWALAATDHTVYVGGGFGRAGSFPQTCLAAIETTEREQGPMNQDFLQVRCLPNPVGDHALIRYTLPGSVGVKLTIFDLQGRTIARVLRGARQSAGEKEVQVSTAGWRPGCYHYQLEAGGLSTTKKFVVVR